MIYLGGSLKEECRERVIAIGNTLRTRGLDVFDQWVCASWNADDCLRDYFKTRGMNFRDALKSPAAQTIFHFDKEWIDRASTFVLVMPAGKSGFLELGYALGRGKRGYLLFPDGDPERIDIMMNFADDIFYSVDDLADRLVSDEEVRAHA